MGVYNVGEGGLGQTYGPTAQLIAAYVVLRRPIAIGVAPNCISKRLGNRTPGGRDRALFTPDSQPIAVQLPAGRYSRNSWGTLDLRGGIRVRCRARGGKLWITGGGQVDKVLPSVCERSVSRAGLRPDRPLPAPRLPRRVRAHGSGRRDRARARRPAAAGCCSAARTGDRVRMTAPCHAHTVTVSCAHKFRVMRARLAS